jgi:hypothetical protein
MPHPLSPDPVPGLALGPAIPEIYPPGEGRLCLAGGAFADVAPLRERRPVHQRSRRLVVCGSVGRRWPVPGPGVISS